LGLQTVNGTFALGTFSETITTLAGGGAVTTGNGSVLTLGGVADYSFIGIISGTGGIAKAGTGTLTLQDATSRIAIGGTANAPAAGMICLQDNGFISPGDAGWDLPGVFSINNGQSTNLLVRAARSTSVSPIRIQRIRFWSATAASTSPAARST